MDFEGVGGCELLRSLGDLSFEGVGEFELWRSLEIRVVEEKFVKMVLKGVV